MNAVEQWADAHRRDLIDRQGIGERVATMLAARVAAAHARSKGPNVSTWPAPSQPITDYDTGAGDRANADEEAA